MLGRTGLDVSLVSLGTGGPSGFGQSRGATSEEQYALVHGALDMGINFFDTAAGYRKSEELLGQTLKDVPRDKYILASKCSLTTSFQDYSDFLPAERIVEQCEQSLARLGLDVIDVYQLHGVHPDYYQETVERFYPVLDKLRDQGKIRFLGITETFQVDPSHKMLEHAVPGGLWDTIMVKYGILNQTAAHRLLPLCIEHDVGVLNMATVRVALATPEALTKLVADWIEKGFLTPNDLPTDDPLGWLVDDVSPNVVAASYKFGAEPPAISTVLTGTANLEHLRENVEAILGPGLPDDKKQRLAHVLGHIADGGV